ncbi:MAG: DUF6907 domain-containing protein [Frankiaceae bacterium]
MATDWHALDPCPPWCVDQDAEGTADHPAQHSTAPLGVTGDGAAAVPFLAHGVKEPGMVDPVVVLGRSDEQYMALSTGSTRSLAAALVRLADVLEGLATA